MRAAAAGDTVSPASSPQQSEAPRVIYVDLERALVRTDLTFERIAMLLKRAPLKLLAALGSLSGGRARFNAKLGTSAQLDVAYLPYRERVVEHLKVRREAGDAIV